ncbi:phage tail protein [Streptomyces sp. NPDC005246]|uniref:phage tail tube protein n=1 Tax=Streptomyces sp. NPDC005246 TaxID=3156716 RepID=UPI0033A3F51B
MSADNTQVRVGVTGAVYVAPVGTTAPTDPYTPWGAGWIDLGYCTEDGLTESLNEDRQEFKAWGRKRPVRTQITNRTNTFKIGTQETKAHTVSLFYGVDIADMTSSGTGDTQFISWNEPEDPEPMYYALGMDVIDGDYPKRIVVARAEVTAKGDIVYKADQTVSYDLTFTALEAASGVSAINYMLGKVALPA